MRTRDAVLVGAAAVVLGAAGTATVIGLRPAPAPNVPTATAGRSPGASRSPTGALPDLKAGSYQGIKPAIIAFSADGGDIITGIHWSQWTATEAVGTGTRDLQNCIPNCAEGANTLVPETLVLSQPEDGFFTVIVATVDGSTYEYVQGSSSLWPLAADQTGQS